MAHQSKQVLTNGGAQEYPDGFPNPGVFFRQPPNDNSSDKRAENALIRAKTDEADEEVESRISAAIASAGDRGWKAHVSLDPSVTGSTFASGVTRTADVLLSIVLAVVLLPVIMGVAALVAVSDPGPVLFRQRRIGRDGKSFVCLKFRTMFVGAEQRLAHYLAQDPELRAEWERSQKLVDDPRVTPIGKILRSTSLDELPQLLNVLRGEMTFVGPRPIIESEACRYGRFIRHYCRVRPGLTGLWQVSGRNATTYGRRVALDVFYVRQRSIALDLRILLLTVPAVLLKRGAS